MNRICFPSVNMQASLGQSQGAQNQQHRTRRDQKEKNTYLTRYENNGGAQLAKPSAEERDKGLGDVGLRRHYLLRRLRKGKRKCARDQRHILRRQTVAAARPIRASAFGFSNSTATVFNRTAQGGPGLTLCQVRSSRTNAETPQSSGNRRQHTS